jgi:hypothetical protein
MRMHVDGPDALAADHDGQLLTRSLRIGVVQQSATAKQDAGGSGRATSKKAAA